MKLNMKEGEYKVKTKLSLCNGVVRQLLVNMALEWVRTMEKLLVCIDGSQTKGIFTSCSADWDLLLHV